jgi:hypothetical protein
MATKQPADAALDFSDIPEVTDFSKAVRGRFHPRRLELEREVRRLREALRLACQDLRGPGVPVDDLVADYLREAERPSSAQADTSFPVGPEQGAPRLLPGDHER